MLRFLILALSFPALARAESPGFAVIAGDPATARLIAIVARDAAGPAVSAAPSPYDATLEFACDLRADDPGAAAKRLAGALRALPHGAKRHLWTEGIAGLLARRAVDELAGPDVVDALILVDVPNRGLSPSGWPEWDAALAGTPNWTISGSAFLRELNAKRQRELDVLTFNFWRRGGRTAPRASVLQLPRASLSAVVDAAAGPFWNILDAPVAAARRLGAEGPPLRIPAATAAQDAALRAARSAPSPAPPVRELLAGRFVLPGAADTHWVEFAAKPGPATDALDRLTDIVAVRYLPADRRAAVAGFEDYFREPLRSDLLVAAIGAYRKGLPAISIDPRRPADPPGQAPVRYEGGLAGSRLGGLMFEADRVMKALSLGRDNMTRGEIGSAVESYIAIAGVRPREYSAQETMWRLWFEPARWHSYEPDPLSAVFDARFRVNWQKMTEGYAPSGPVVKFTDSLTRDFERYAQEQPSFDQLDQCARVMALASWFVEGRLNITDPAGAPRQASTPSRTPLIEVTSSGTFDRYQVTQIMQGGAVAAPGLRHVRTPPADYDALFKSIQALYPSLAPRPPPVVSTAPTTAGRRSTPNVLPRPPTLTAGFHIEDVVYRAAFFDAQSPQAPPGIRFAQDSKDSPPKTVDDIIRARALAPQLDRVSVDDAEDSPVMSFRGSKFGDTRGEIVFDGEKLPIVYWSDSVVLASAPRPLRAGRVVLRSVNNESNPFDLRIVSSAPAPAPPSLKIENRTDFAIDISIDAEIFGSVRRFTLAPGGTRATRLMAGRYRIAAAPSDARAVVSGKSDWKIFEPQYEYQLIYERAMFAASDVGFDNGSGGPARVRIRGPMNRTFEIGPGLTKVPVAPGDYAVEVESSCGTISRALKVDAGSTQTLRFSCVRR